ncbi:MAG TPA: HAMP domain-containing sensor histidine kinase [Thermodesulfovibrionales bacterium]|nr:HAMP domain-containing sensor histidine kinase [Thermodesulfovibrionales bacterium]
MKNILERIESKKTDYGRYGFTRTENIALMTFFDLAQEYDDVGDFYSLCVAIPRSFFEMEARLYLVDSKSTDLRLTTATDMGSDDLLLPSEVDFEKLPYYTDRRSLVLPIRGKRIHSDDATSSRDNLLGLLQVYPVPDMDMHTTLFFEKYANRIGFSMHNRFLASKNIEHLKFIRTLVADIEHNVIVPNMIYKLFLRRLKGKIKKNRQIEDRFSAALRKGDHDEASMEVLLKELSEVNQGLDGEYENIEKHYKNMSLFLETLFRRSHFDQGRLILRTKTCNMKNDIVQPQLERYMEQFEKAGISIDDHLSGIPDGEVISVVDVGLIAQVYANLFSNALKYAQEIADESGEKKKYLSYGRQIIKDCFGEGKDGIKYNVFTTGPHIPPEDRDRIFEEEYRGSNTLNRPGTGHGLAFIKNAVEMHGGIAGYEATKDGNNFFFIIPKSP